MNLPAKRIAIIGGGITGLAAAQRIVEQAPDADVTIYEASGRVGGVIRTTTQEGFAFEHSADSFIVSDELPWAGELCRKLDVELIPTVKRHRRALILKGDRFYPVPDGLQLLSVRKMSGIFATPLLSLRGKMRVALEPFVRAKRSDEEESLQEFTTRRLGREMFERIVQPLVAGIYTADPRKLSVAAALPQFVAQEQKYGSLARAAVAARSAIADRGARYSLFQSPREGMQSLINALEQRLAEVRVFRNQPVREIDCSEGAWWLRGTHGEPTPFDAVICATPAPTLGKLLTNVAGQLATKVEEIEHVSTAVVCMGYRRAQVSHPLNAFGCVIPAVEQRKILAVSFTNVKFPSRAPDDHILMRAFVGGALQEEFASLDDEPLLSIVRQELSELLGVKGDPITRKIVRWPQTTPQYHIGHTDRVQAVRRAVEALPGLEIAGNVYQGVGVPQCVRSGWDAADRVLRFID